MTTYRIGILHPGAMGVSIAANLHRNGQLVCWVAADRSPATAARAAEHGLIDAGTLADLCRESQLIISVCPPHAAEAVAQAVVQAGFHGLYLDANAIAPQRVVRMAELLASAGIDLVDGGIIGGPAWQPGTALYLAGPRVAEVAACFGSGPLAVRVLDATIGKASALKICYAAYSKGTTALLAAILAAAEHYQVAQALREQWDHDDPVLATQAERRARQATAKAWRFAGEMEEIAATFAAAGLPDGFHLAAAELYTRLAHFKDAATIPELADVLAALGQDAATKPYSR